MIGVQDETPDQASPGSGRAPRKRERASPRKAAMDLLARREHSLLELREKLLRRFNEAELRDVLARLADEGLQSDARFAESFTRERLHRAYGPRRIRAELQQRGVSETTIDAVLDAVPRAEGVCWSAKAREALERRFGAAPAVDLQDKARRHRFLYQRGFSADDCREALRD